MRHNDTRRGHTNRRRRHSETLHPGTIALAKPAAPVQVRATCTAVVTAPAAPASSRIAACDRRRSRRHSRMRYCRGRKRRARRNSRWRSFDHQRCRPPRRCRLPRCRRAFPFCLREFQGRIGPRTGSEQERQQQQCGNANRRHEPSSASRPLRPRRRESYPLRPNSLRRNSGTFAALNAATRASNCGSMLPAP